ncbi:sigma-70 family RNA polymerase sigma factor [Singulisphaera sp. PoT]|uniref:sigma-70 family RNA polymerase sigma factor n=1 Tax=Singulisphaera sp. PoT TaxID=3411797 RepID=UPI003BF5A9D8
MTSESTETTRLLEQASLGDPAAIETILMRHRQRLRRMVVARLDQRLSKRIDPSDVIQEAYLEASVRLPAYLREPKMPFFLWLRFLTAQKIITLHRKHIGVQMRGAGQEVALACGMFPQASSAAIAADLLDQGTRPSEAAVRAERNERLRQALDQLPPLDREALALRHFEQLSRSEIAIVLGVTEAAAGKRYLRALEKLKQLLDPFEGDREGLFP